MNERERTYLLDAMGISQFVPRFQLPAAAPAVLCAGWAAEKVDTAEPVLRSASDVPSFNAPSSSVQSSNVQSFRVQPPSAEGALRLMDALDLASRVATTAGHHPIDTGTNVALQSLMATPPSPQRAQQMAETPLPVRGEATLAAMGRPAPIAFQLRVWTLPSGVLWIDSHEPQAALPQAGLLANILRAFNPLWTLPQADLLQWPLPHLPKAAQSADAAHEMVQAFIESRLESLRASGTASSVGLIVSGQMAMRWVAPQSVPQEALSPDAPLPQLLPATSTLFGCTLLCLPSLTQLLKTPALKAMLWSALAPYWR
jgi:hypothetical protein